MLKYDFDKLGKNEKYGLLIGSVIPRPVILLSTIDDKGVVNLAPFSFYNMVSYDPALLMVSVQRVNGTMKDTARNVLLKKEAVGHVVSENILEEVNKTASNVPYGQSELELTNLSLEKSDKVGVPKIKEALVTYELTLHKADTIENEDGEIVADVLYLKVINMSVHESVVEGNHIIADKLAPISRLAGNDYAKLGEIKTLVRPK